MPKKVPPCDFPIGELNNVRKAFTAPTLDPKTTNLKGISIKRAVESYTQKFSLTSSGKWNAIVLRVEKYNSRRNFLNTKSGAGSYTEPGEAKLNLVKVWARIPELHAGLRCPLRYGDEGKHTDPHQHKISRYPLFVAATTDLDAPACGSIIRVSFGNADWGTDGVYEAHVAAARYIGGAASEIVASAVMAAGKEEEQKKDFKKLKEEINCRISSDDEESSLDAPRPRRRSYNSNQTAAETAPQRSGGENQCQAVGEQTQAPTPDPCASVPPRQNNAQKQQAGMGCVGWTAVGIEGHYNTAAQLKCHCKWYTGPLVDVPGTLRGIRYPSQGGTRATIPRGGLFPGYPNFDASRDGPLVTGIVMHDTASPYRLRWQARRGPDCEGRGCGTLPDPPETLPETEFAQGETNVLRTWTKEGASSHFIIRSPTLDSGDIITQHFHTLEISNHGEWTNSSTIGVDMTFSPNLRKRKNKKKKVGSRRDRPITIYGRGGNSDSPKNYQIPSFSQMRLLDELVEALINDSTNHPKLFSIYQDWLSSPDKRANEYGRDPNGPESYGEWVSRFFPFAVIKVNDSGEPDDNGTPKFCMALKRRPPNGTWQSLRVGNDGEPSNGHPGRFSYTARRQLPDAFPGVNGSPAWPPANIRIRRTPLIGIAAHSRWDGNRTDGRHQIYFLIAVYAAGYSVEDAWWATAGMLKGNEPFPPLPHPDNREDLVLAGKEAIKESIQKSTGVHLTNTKRWIPPLNLQSLLPKLLTVQEIRENWSTPDSVNVEFVGTGLVVSEGQQGTIKNQIVAALEHEGDYRVFVLIHDREITSKESFISGYSDNIYNSMKGSRQKLAEAQRKVDALQKRIGQGQAAAALERLGNLNHELRKAREEVESLKLAHQKNDLFITMSIFKDGASWQGIIEKIVPPWTSVPTEERTSRAIIKALKSLIRDKDHPRAGE